MLDSVLLACVWRSQGVIVLVYELIKEEEEEKQKARRSKTR